MEGKTFERELPKGYKLGDVIDATHGKFATKLLVASSLLLIVSIGFLALPFLLDPSRSISYEYLTGEECSLYFFGGCMLSIVYTILHELVHGAVYKKYTGEKLTYGLALTCAYCGVPKIFVYRKPAVVAAIAPFILFTIVLIPVLAICYFYSIGLYVAIGVLFALHFSGCAGDLYVTFLFATKYKDNRVLTNDTGPRSAFFIPTDAEEFDEATISFLEQKKAEEAKKKN